jgi:hypothetical protein
MERMKADTEVHETVKPSQYAKKNKARVAHAVEEITV